MQGPIGVWVKIDNPCIAFLVIMFSRGPCFISWAGPMLEAPYEIAFRTCVNNHVLVEAVQVIRHLRDQGNVVVEVPTLWT